MSKNLSVSIAIGAVLASSFRSNIGKASKALRTVSDSVAKANQKAAEMSRIISQRNAVGQASREYIQASRRVAELGRALHAASQPSRQMTTEFNRAQAACRRASAELNRQRDALRGMEAAAGTAGRPLRALVQEQARLAAAAERANRMQALRGRLGAAVSRGKTAFQDMKPGAVAASGVLGSAVATGMSFDQQMARVGAVARASGADLAALREQAKQMGKTTQWSAVQAAEGMQFLAMAGFKTQQIMQTMPGMLNLASAASIDLGRAADIASNILTGFGLEASEMKRVGDVLTNAFTSSNTSLEMLGQSMKYVGPAAKAFGLSLEETTALVAKLGDAGIQADQAGTALRQMMVRMAKPTKQVSTAMAQIGLQVKDSNGKMKSMTTILAEMAAATGKLTQAEKLRISAAIFGTEAMSAGLVLMKEAAKGTLPEYIKALGKEGTAAEVARRQNDNLAGDVTILKSAWEGLQITIFEKVNPALRQVTQKMTEMIAFVTDWTEKHDTLSKVLLGGVAAISALVVAIVPLGMIVSGVTGFIGMCSAAFSGLGAAFAFVAPYLGAAATTLGSILAAISPMGLAIAGVVGILAALGVAIYKNWDACKAFVTSVCTELFVELGQACRNIYNIFVSVFTGIGEVVKAAVNWIIRGINKMISGINSLASVKLPGALGGGTLGVSIAAIPEFASGGIVTSPTLALVGEGRESEAVLPLSKLENLIGARGGSGEINVNLVVNVSGSGTDQDNIRQGLQAGVRDLKRELARLMQEERRLSFA